ncbi:MAG: PIN domain-containing protein [Bacteroidetes bacterium]|nr:PIN domain-containing protein [Bacteroidota bacterium]
MKVLIDSEVLLDIALDRQPFSIHSEQAINELLLAGIELHVTLVIIANVIYILSKHCGSTIAKQFVFRVLGFCKMLPIKSSGILKSFEQNHNDLEDGIQIVAAEDGKMDLILTRNLRNYKLSKLAFRTPEQLLAS